MTSCLSRIRSVLAICSPGEDGLLMCCSLQVFSYLYPFISVGFGFFYILKVIIGNYLIGVSSIRRLLKWILGKTHSAGFARDFRIQHGSCNGEEYLLVSFLLSCVFKVSYNVHLLIMCSWHSIFWNGFRTCNINDSIGVFYEWLWVGE